MRSALDTLNARNNSTNKSYKDLVIDQRYLIISSELKRNAYGERVALWLRDPEDVDPENKFMLYLSPWYLDNGVVGALKTRLKGKNIRTYLVLIAIDIDGDKIYPKYQFVGDEASK